MIAHTVYIAILDQLQLEVLLPCSSRYAIGVPQFIPLLDFMLVIRLQRTGRKNEPTFRVVLADKRKSAKGKFLEVLGHYLPSRGESVFECDTERVLHWVSLGAQPSNTLARLLKRAGTDGMDKFIDGYTKKQPRKEMEKEAVTPPPAAEKSEEVKNEKEETSEKAEAPKEEKVEEAKEEVKEEKSEEKKEEKPIKEEKEEAPVEEKPAKEEKKQEPKAEDKPEEKKEEEGDKESDED